GHADREPERFQHFLIQPLQSTFQLGPSFNNSGRKYPAALRDLERRRPISTRHAVDHLPLKPDRIDVKDVARHKPLEHREGLLIGKAVNFVPNISFVAEFVNAYCASHKAWLQ